MNKKTVISLCFIFVLFFASTSFAANWYVDNQATGANNGISWENGWQSFGDIDWGAIQPGDTVYISGGDTSKTYNENFVISASGTESNPLFIRSGQDANHTGRVIINGIINFDAENWITINGNYNNAINIEITRPTGTCIYSTSPIGIKIQYLEVHDCGDERDEHGIRFNGYNGLPSDAEISYSHIHDTYQDGINVGRSNASSYGEISIHDNIIERVGDDGIQIGAGADIYNNIIRDRIDTGAPSHADGIQGVGSYFRIYNNEIYDFGNSMIFIETTQESVAHWQIYNNLLYIDDMIAGSTRGMELKAKNCNRCEENYDLVTWDDILIANNIFFNFYEFVVIRFGSTQNVDQLNTTNTFISNNIFYNNKYNYWGDETLVENNNIFYAGADANCSSCNQATPSNGIIIEPKFVDYNNKDFHLQSNSPAIDNGTDLSSYFTTDKDGITRPQGSAWDIGAYEYKSIAPSPPSKFKLVQ